VLLGYNSVQPALSLEGSVPRETPCRHPFLTVSRPVFSSKYLSSDHLHTLLYAGFSTTPFHSICSALFSSRSRVYPHSPYVVTPGRPASCSDSLTHHETLLRKERICKPLDFNALQTHKDLKSHKSFACHSYENCRVYTNNSHSGTHPSPLHSAAFRSTGVLASRRSDMRTFRRLDESSAVVSFQSMNIQLTEVECRVLGSLVEKEITTPEHYPLSLNALLNACNQKSNREPVMTLDESAVRQALHSLDGQSLVRSVSASDSRVTKYEHRLQEAFNFYRHEIAILCVLLLRGPQTPGELRTRAERMHPFEDLSAVQSSLQHLMKREPPLAKILPRQPGSKEARYAHLLAGDVEFLEAKSENEPAANSPSPDAARVAHLEEEIASLRKEVADLKQQFASFRKQFE
jgi:uncharacterized protein YceH (UPF0502 family)